MRPSGVLPLLLLLVLLALAGAGCGSDEEGEAGGTITPETGIDEGSGSGNLSVALRELEGSGESGSATVTAEAGEQVRVTIQMDTADRGALSAQIQQGSCEEMSGSAEHELEDVQGGRSDTLLDGVAIDELQDGDYAIVILDAEGSAAGVACGEIGSAG